VALGLVASAISVSTETATGGPTSAAPGAMAAAGGRFRGWIGFGRDGDSRSDLVEEAWFVSWFYGWKDAGAAALRGRIWALLSTDMASRWFRSLLVT
jgi:hypothetical protein